MVLHMDEATPHLHVDFVPVAPGQSRGLSTRVSMKQALKQQGFESLGRKQTEWKAWMAVSYTNLDVYKRQHLYYVLKEPVPMYPHNQKCLKELKLSLIHI